MVAAEALLFSGNQIVGRWFTPIVWTGYILFVDALVYAAQGSIAADDRSARVSRRSRGFNRRVVAVRVLQRAPILEIRSGTLVALSQPRAESDAAPRRL